MARREEVPPVGDPPRLEEALAPREEALVPLEEALPAVVVPHVEGRPGVAEVVVVRE